MATEGNEECLSRPVGPRKVAANKVDITFLGELWVKRPTQTPSQLSMAR